MMSKPAQHWENAQEQLAPESPKTVADVILTALSQAGVDVMFGFPGETSLPLYLAAQRQQRVRHVLARCPRCAGYMADAFARVSGRVGACDAPGGIGSPFTIPALLESYNSSVPLVFISSGTARHRRGRWTTGECAQQELFGAVTKFSERIEVPDDVVGRVIAAVRHALSPRSGPVYLEIPSDLFSLPTPDMSWADRHALLPKAAPAPHVTALVARHIKAAASAVIIAGGGVHLGGAEEELRALIQATGLPVATTLNGKGAIDERLPNALGVTGAKGSFTANDAVQSADCIVVLGSKLGDKSTNGYRWPSAKQTLFHVDSSATELSRFGHPGIPVLSDAGVFCQALMRELGDYHYEGTINPPASPFWAPGLSDYLCKRLTPELEDEDVVVADASVSSGWAGAALRLYGARRRLLTPRGSGSISYALPASLGAKIARPQARIFAIGGDAGFAMAMHEMETAVRNDLPITYFLLNNERLGLIDRHATELSGGQPISSKFSHLDWQSIAPAMGWRSYKVTSGDELDKIWETICDAAVPTLVECVVPPDEEAPDYIVTREHARKGRS